MSQLLESELETFEKNKTRLVSSSEGKFVLIHDGQVAGTFNDEMDAIKEGYRQFGNVPFLVKQILSVESPANFVNNHIGF